MKNEYEVRGDVTAIYIKRRGKPTLETLIDTEDLELVKSMDGIWHAVLSNDKSCYYIKSSTGILMHRFILGATRGVDVDHKYHDTLDNRRDNIRLVTPAQNRQNLRKYKTNTSGERGVYWNKEKGKWRAVVGVDGKVKHIGYFSDKDEAISAVRKARKELLPYSTN